MTKKAWKIIIQVWISNHIPQKSKYCGMCLCLLNFPGQNGHHFADNKFKCIFVNENFCISIEISLNFVLNDPIENKLALVQVMAWRQTGDEA